jgi:NAD(P)H-hydrate repair Nnr-like enzyme with NAD(P)H-hydrate epimerase domain
VEEPAALDLDAAGVIVDALFGAGLARDLDGGGQNLVIAVGRVKALFCHFGLLGKFAHWHCARY